MSKTSETLFPGEYSADSSPSNLNDLVRESSFHDDASALAGNFLRECCNANNNIDYLGDFIDQMTFIFTLCNEYETRYQAIIKKALDEALSKMRAKNDLLDIVFPEVSGEAGQVLAGNQQTGEVTWEFPTSSEECTKGIIIDAKTEEHKGFIDLGEESTP